MRRRAWLGAAIALAVVPAWLNTASASADGPPQITRYSIVHGCYALRSEQTGKFAVKAGPVYTVTATTAAAAEPFRMQASDLGKYLFYGQAEDFMTRTPADTVAPTPKPVAPTADSNWTVNEEGNAFRIVNESANKDLAVGALNALVTVPGGTGGAAGLFTLSPVEGCAVFPEIGLNVQGAPLTHSPYFTETTGTVEGHLHHMAFEFLGGDAHCGKPWSPYGVETAMVDCPDHNPDGCGAVLENVLYGSPARCHNTEGWPGFPEWPAPRSLTHEQTYYRWVERAYRGGLRVFVNLMVENRVLCELYPIKHNSCDEMTSVRREIQDAYALERYIDAQSGGPGKGWYRIVRDPFEARQVINDGKLAVILGMEVSEPFGCRLMNNVPQCDMQDISDGVDELHSLGIRQLELINKFDNALAGVAGDSGTTGTITNTGNFTSTGHYWDLQPCTDPNNHDHSPTNTHNIDQSLANGLGALAPGTTPSYGPDPLCNQLGLSNLGDWAIRRLMDRRMIVDPDHMSVVARDQAMNLLESQNYPGVISSHSWSTPNAEPRIYKLGGFITPYAGTSTNFVQNWQRLRSIRGNDDQYWGIGYGADMNGFGAQGEPRGAGAPNPVTYPFVGLDGRTVIQQQVSGTRVWDINTDGVAQYGLYPDWIQDLRMLAGNQIVDDLNRGAEAYLQMWERAEGVKERACRDLPGHFDRGGLAKYVRLGADPKSVLYSSSQPETRTQVWTWCALNGKRPKRHKLAKKGKNESGRRKMVAVYDSSNTVGLVLSTARRHKARGVGPGMRVAQLRGRHAKKAGKGLWTRKAGKGARYVYGVRGKRIAFVGVASASVVKSGSLRAEVAQSGLR
jgi:microsomal dipeptidase-like Zn-dependent dipeptidase